MNARQDEGTAIARLVGGSSSRTVGWVYLWNTFELGVLWLRRDLAPERIEPPLDPEVLARAKSNCRYTYRQTFCRSNERP